MSVSRRVVTYPTLAHLTLGAPPAESIAAAQKAGFESIGIRIAPRRPEEPYPVRIVGEPETIRSIRQQAGDAGVRISNVQAYQFFPDTRWEEVQAIIATAQALGAPMILAYSFDPDKERFLDIFARYCQEAGNAGLRIAIEFLPYSQIKNLASALEVIERTGASNVGICIDALHLYRSGGSVADVAGLPAERIALVQLCDAPLRTGPMAEPDLITEARTQRRPPGEGNLPLFELLDALPRTVELEYEVAPATRAAWSPLEKAQAARADLDRFLHAYHSR